MKKHTFTSVKIILLSLLMACSNGESPKYVAERFYNAVEAQNYKEAKKYASDETVGLLDMLDSMHKLGIFARNKFDSLKKDNDPRFVAVDEKINGDNATVTYKIVQKPTKDTSGNNTLNAITLKKVKGKWLVAMSKADISNKGPQTPKVGADSTALDSTKKGM